MKYSLLVFISPESWDELSSEDKRSLHGGQDVPASGSTRVIAHYRLREPATATTIQLDGDQIVSIEGPSAITSEGLSGLYLIESDEPQAVLEFAGLHPALQLGGTAEVWPLVEPGRHAQRR